MSKKHYFFYFLCFCLVACDSNKKTTNMDSPTIEEKKQSNLQFTIGLQDSTIYSDGFFSIKIQLKNISSEKVMINKRLSIGYENSISRELYFRILDSSTQEVVSRSAENYDRPPSYFDEYGTLNPLESISKIFDISEWYEIRLPKGKHKLTLLGFYQADEKYFDKRPEKVVNGIFQSDPVTFYWVEK